VLHFIITIRGRGFDCLSDDRRQAASARSASVSKAPGLPASAVVCWNRCQLTWEEAQVLKIAVIPGDGIGPEVVREGLKVLEAAAGATGLSCELQ